jgi:hypothetical protein
MSEPILKRGRGRPRKGVQYNIIKEPPRPRGRPSKGADALTDSCKVGLNLTAIEKKLIHHYCTKLGFNSDSDVVRYFITQYLNSADEEFKPLADVWSFARSLKDSDRLTAYKRQTIIQGLEPTDE